ncbi:arginase [Candidatus Saccharibacteria bacterium CG_4_10_14_0_2_um_filter_52_9]|nr:MAG: arginase [Candidatus Saccharibacteria bacterium CG_4_10_14_0_2_um_filter_52_9]
MPNNPSSKLTLIGVPLDLGAQNLGVDIGPDAFRYQQIVAKLERIGFGVTDSGDVSCNDRKQLERGDPRMHYVDEIVRVNEEVASLSHKAMADKAKVVVLGGDHSINLGAVSGASVALDGKLGLIYLDAHGDMNTAETTLTGNVHGMHLASLLGFGEPELRNVHGKQTKIARQDLLHIGGSDFDQAELDLIKNEQLPAFTLFDLLTSSLGPLLKMINDLATRVPNIWVSLDLDVIDRIYAPGAGMPNAKGLTYREIATIAEYIGSHCNVVGIDIVEYNPLQDEQNKTAELGIELLAKFLGKEYSWYTNYMNDNQVG